MQCGFVLSFLGVFLSAYLIASQTGKGDREGEPASRKREESGDKLLHCPISFSPFSSGVSEILNLCRVIESCFYDRKGKGRSGRQGGNSCER